MLTTNIYQAKTQLSKLIEQAIAGQDIVISKAGKPVVKLVAYAPTVKARVPGKLKGKIFMSDDFTDESKELDTMFYGG